MEAEIKKLEQMILNCEEYNDIIRQSEQLDEWVEQIIKDHM